MTRQDQLIRLNRAAQRLQRFFQRKPGIRIDVILPRLAGPILPGEDVTPNEQVAAIALWSACQPMDELIQRLYAQSLESSPDRFSNQFFAALEQTVADLERAGLDRAAADLLKVGAVLAEMTQFRELAEDYRQRISKKLANHIRDLPYKKQSGW